MTMTSRDRVLDEYGGVTLNALGLALGVFGFALFGMGRFAEQARAQTTRQTEVALTLPLNDVQMTATARAQVEAALHALNDADLSLTYARIHATFRDYVGRDDLTVARALCDYALLAEAELHARGILRPLGTESAHEMLVTYQLVL